MSVDPRSDLSTRCAGCLIVSFAAFGPAFLSIVFNLAHWLARIVSTGQVEPSLRGVTEPVALIGFYAYVFGGPLFLAGGIAIAIASGFRRAPLTLLHAATTAVFVLGLAWAAFIMLNPDRYSPAALMKFKSFVLPLAAAFVVSFEICTRLTRRWQ